MAALTTAVAEGDIEAVTNLLSKGADVNERSKDGMTPLSIAAFWGYSDIAKLLLKHGADINAQNSGNGWTGLHCAAFQGQGPVVLALMEHHPDLTIKDSKGRTAVDFASALDSIWSFFAAANCQRTPKARLIEMSIIYKVTEDVEGVPVHTKVDHISRPGSAYAFRFPTLTYGDPRMELAAVTGDVLAGVQEDTN